MDWLRSFWNSLVVLVGMIQAHQVAARFPFRKVVKGEVVSTFQSGIAREFVLHLECGHSKRITVTEEDPVQCEECYTAALELAANPEAR
jgi:hypothetical protein